MKYLYKYPQPAVPYRGPGRDQPQAHARRLRIRAARHRRLRRRPLFRRLRRICQGGARRHPDPDHGPQPGPEAAAPSPAADAVVSQHLVLGPGRAESRCFVKRRRGGDSKPSHVRSSAAITLYCDGEAPTAVHRKRDATASGCSAASRIQRRIVKDGINDYVVGRRTRGGEPREEGNQGRSALSSDRRAGRAASFARSDCG